MKVYINTSFKGHHPVGTSALIIAGNSSEAANLLETALSNNFLTQEVLDEEMKEISLNEARAIIMQDGDY